MNAQTVVAILRGKIREAQGAPGATPETGITLQSLDRLVTQLEKDVAANPSLDVTSAVVAQLQLQQASDLAKYNADVAGRLEVFKSVLTSAALAIRSLTLINGGSAVALLAFIGHLATTGDRTESVGLLAVPLFYFVGGAGGAALTAGVVCIAQKCFALRWIKIGNFFVALGFAIGLASLGCFLMGAASAYPIFRDMDTTALQRQVLAVWRP